MKRDNTLTRATIGLLIASLTYSLTVAAVPAETRPNLEFKAPMTGALELAQSDADSLERALKLLESRAESRNTAPTTPAPAPISEPAPPLAAPPQPARRLETENAVSAPALAPTPAVAPVTPILPAAPVAPTPVPAPLPTPASTPETSIPAAPRSPIPNAVEPKPTTPEAPPAVPRPAVEKPHASTTTSRRADPPPATPTAATTSSRWQVQLLAGRVLARVEQDQDDLLRFHGEHFNNVKLAITPVRDGGPYRLRAHDWANRAEAQAWCQRVQKATGLQCQVVPPEAAPAARQ
ncbi:Sporulation related domain-containing protein [Allochromatium warmingii]|uniref:Sporulation related domain-containing protein n=1 Tax=Allochromatium warmingii TaxID=61595 RepID=A0A1H3EC37_ALLWA|nr:SPOR domain-containing protein [Allochromatium warmingii]SDX75469.1 Sporulation related domain-containing protein [Allochromatium warmingii]